MDDIHDANTAYGALVQNIEEAEEDVVDMEHSVAQHNRAMLLVGAGLHTDIAFLKEQVEELHADLEDYKQKLLKLVAEFRNVVHEEQVTTLGKHVDAMQFEKALMRSQVKDMMKKYL